MATAQGCVLQKFVSPRFGRKTGQTSYHRLINSSELRLTARVGLNFATTMELSQVLKSDVSLKKGIVVAMVNKNLQN